ncbi:helix-turn-helix domain-containing protein [Mammaliicoccus sciuri]|uniref:helix-turn-helix domain-containing protein n=1 Tax=Mammaliicoccus sciuri TaxID=1296 RepID=UPI001FB1CFCD|nr:helix-turn-helix domain-containing protein [Mammaliicoccus sciuri]MCJ0965005.1 helix-turn-helix domain-containing protein [Mammaliicoccus sciuri]
MFNFNINFISHENKWIYHNEYASIIYVTNGYINIFYHTSNYMMTLNKGFLCIVPYDEYSFIYAVNGQICILNINKFLIYTLASNIYEYFLLKNFYPIIQSFKFDKVYDHLNTLNILAPYHKEQLTTTVSTSIITLLDDIKQPPYPKISTNDSYVSLYHHNHYRNRQLFEATVALIFNTHQSISDVALEYDFYDQAHFTKVFKNHRNMTSLHFRKRYNVYSHYK